MAVFFYLACLKLYSWEVVKVRALKERVVLREEGLPFNIGIQKRLVNKPLIPSEDLWHEFAEIIYVIEGYVDQKINGIAYKMEKGDMAFINGMDFHSLYFYPGVSSKLLVIQIPPSFLSLFYRGAISFRITSNYFKYSAEDTVSTEINECMGLMIEELMEKKDAYTYYMTSYLYKLLGIISRNSEVKSRDADEFIHQKLLLEKMAPALEYIHKNFKNQISVKEISSHLGMCGQYFCKCFKKATKYTFTNYLNEIRILHAQDMLLTTDMNITEIAFSSGFSSTSYFNRTFKRISGINPLQFRRK